MIVIEAESICEEIDFIINEFYIFLRKNHDELKNNYDFTTSLKESIDYLKDYKQLLKNKISSATMDL